MFNFIALSKNHFLNKAVSETINIIKQNEFVNILPSSLFTHTRHVITLNDTNPLNSLVILAGMPCIADGDIVIILSNLVTEKLARRFVPVNNRLICLPQRSSVERLINTYIAFNPVVEGKSKTKKTIFLHQEEKRLLLSINKGNSVRALSRAFSLSEKKTSAYKICIMKKMGISKNTQLLQIINSRHLLQAMSFL